MSTHATPEQLNAIALSHGTSDSTIHARVVAVITALDAGTDVKTIAADLVAANAKDGRITVVGESVLGHAKATATILRKLEIAVETAPITVAAGIYRAVQRHGVTVAMRDIVQAADGAKTPAAKMERAAKRADSMVAAAVAKRAAKGTGRVTAAPAAPVSDTAKVLRGIAGSIASGQMTVTPEILAAASALVEALKATAPKAPATPAKARATVKA